MWYSWIVCFVLFLQQHLKSNEIIWCISLSKNNSKKHSRRRRKRRNYPWQSFSICFQCIDQIWQLRPTCKTYLIYNNVTIKKKTTRMEEGKRFPLLHNEPHSRPRLSGEDSSRSKSFFSQSPPRLPQQNVTASGLFWRFCAQRQLAHRWCTQ